MKPWKRNLISAFIIFNIVGILVGQAFNNGPIGKFYSPYLVRTRLLQRWNLFSPSPGKFARKYRVDITFQDGAKASWKRPYPPNWGFFERHLAYHFQKWDLSGDRLEEKGILWPDLSAFIQRLYWNDQNPPVLIELIREQAPVLPPHETGYAMHDESELSWTDYLVFKYFIREKRFEP